MLPYERGGLTWLQITVEMDLNRVDYSRSRYTVFDLLSDVGGLSGIFFSVFAVIMSAWNFNSLDNYMVMHLFKEKVVEPTPQSNDAEGKRKTGSKFFPEKRLPYFKDYFMSWVPDCCQRCCRPTRRERAFEIARERLEKELNIIELVKQ